MADARSAGGVLGCVPVPPTLGGALRLLAAAIGARAAVGVGTGTGLSGLRLIRGMSRDGALTSIDVDPEHRRIATAAFAAAGHGSARLRLINGVVLEVLPRRTDAGYDLVPVDAAQPTSLAARTRSRGCCGGRDRWPARHARRRCARPGRVRPGDLRAARGGPRSATMTVSP